MKISMVRICTANADIFERITEMDNLPAQKCFAGIPGVEEPKAFLLYEWDDEE
jgi:hypothetical protein